MNFLLLFLNRYKFEIIIGAIVLSILGYIWFLRHSVESIQEDYNNYKVQVEKNNLEYYKKIKDQELEFKDYQHKFDLATAKEKITIIERVKTEIKVIRVSDLNNTLPPLEGNCTNQLK